MQEQRTVRESCLDGEERNGGVWCRNERGVGGIRGCGTPEDAEGSSNENKTLEAAADELEATPIRHCTGMCFHDRTYLINTENFVVDSSRGDRYGFLRAENFLQIIPVFRDTRHLLLCKWFLIYKHFLI